MTLGVRQGGEDGQAYTLILLFIGMTLEKDGVELYVLNEKDKPNDSFQCIAIQQLSEYISALLPNMFCISIVACKKERYNILRFGGIVNPYSIEMGRLITCCTTLPSCTDSLAKHSEFNCKEFNNSNFLVVSEAINIRSTT